MKRLFDIIGSAIGLIILSPLLIIVALMVALESKGGAFYAQVRTGKNGTTFKLFKFRSMYINSERSGKLTIGKDPRITRMGHFIRRSKLDELPQLWNVFIGDMSLVGPRPEVPEYTKLYNPEQLKVLSIRPGITDWASIKYRSESEILGKAQNPEKTYIEEIMPDKLRLNLEYLEHQSMFMDLKILYSTILKIFKSQHPIHE